MADREQTRRDKPTKALIDSMLAKIARLEAALEQAERKRDEALTNATGWEARARNAERERREARTERDEFHKAYERLSRKQE